METRHIILALSGVCVIILMSALSYALNVRDNFLINKIPQELVPQEIILANGMSISSLGGNPSIPDLPGDFVLLPEGSFKLRIPEWWEQVDTKKFSGEPYRFANIQHVFLNNKNSCALVYSGKPQVPNGESHYIYPTQIIDQQTTININTQRRLLASRAPQNPATTTPGVYYMGGDGSDPYLPYEFAHFFMTNPDGNSFYLISTNEKPLTSQCESEVRSILKTFTRAFATSTLANTQGSLFIGSDLTPINTEIYSLFLANNDQANSAIKKIFTFPKGSSQFIFSQRDQTLSYVVNAEHPTIFRAKVATDGTIEVKESTNEAGALMVPKGSIIVDFLTVGNTTYYLAGPATCNEYMGSCDTILFSYDSKTGTQDKIAENLHDRTIIGPSSDNSEILIASYFGDGGCWGSSYLRVKIADGETIGAGSFNGCADDFGRNINSEQERGQRELVNRFGGEPFKGMVYKFDYNGTTIAPAQTTNDESQKFQRDMFSYQISLMNIRTARNF